LTNSPFPSYYEELIHVSRYARWREEDNRRETWDETVRRLVNYYSQWEAITPEIHQELYDAIYNLEVMPSMRAMMTAGPALDRCNVAGYNCAYLPIDHPYCFDEAMYILLCGTGVGYSVERKYVDNLPQVPEELFEEGTTIVVGDSKAGWAKGFRQLLALLFGGSIPKWDVSKVRPAGARLKTFGGRASGPEPLVNLFEYTVSLFKRAKGRKLSSLECHDLVCKIAEIVVVGGVRRSALISLSDVTDDRMRGAKMGSWWLANSERALANNSAVYEHRRPDMDLFMKEWTSLYESKSGERGIFSRYACQTIAGRNGRRDSDRDFGTNPCSEIILRPFQFCNLSEVVVRSDDSLNELKRKVRIATILGTIQSSFTDFKYLRKIWRDNCEEERLLGVSLTGVLDRGMSESELEELKNVAIATNTEWAGLLGIPPSTAITCVKPSGTVSQLVNAASGMHGRHSPFYVRTIRSDIKDPLTTFLIDAGVPWETDLMKDSQIVFSFPQKAPEGAMMREDLSAIQMLEEWKKLQDHWCEHKPSVTISVKEEEWMDVGAWVFANFDELSGVSFLPYDGGSYKQAPYQEITEEEYVEWIKKMPESIDWTRLQEFEKEDTTTGSQELACVAGFCEIVTIGEG
jgi:ribonucleoside-triphosphate reductase